MKKCIWMAALLVAVGAKAETWTLQDCIQHALTHNITIQKNRVSEEEGKSTLKQTKSTLWPSLNFSISEGVGYRPLQDDIKAMSVNGEVVTSSSKVTGNGSASVSMNWTVWNGGVNHKNVEAQEIKNKISEYTTETSTLTIQEQIAQLYVQIMYTKEAKKVNEELERIAQAQYDRGVEMQKNGQMSKADVVSLESQMESAKYNVIAIQAQTDNFVRQLKSLLQLDLSTAFDVSGEIPSDEAAMQLIPNAQEVYSEALSTRPEIKSAEMNIKGADVALNIAKRGFYPTISISAGLSDNHATSSSSSFGNQLKQNLNLAGSVNISVPIWDQRKTKTSIEKARLEQTASRLDLEDKKNNLSSTIEKYWIDATNNQSKFVSAQAKLKSQRASFELVNEQFQNGLKEVVDVLQSRGLILSAEQDLLETKYNTILNTQLLKFYKGEELKL